MGRSARARVWIGALGAVVAFGAAGARAQEAQVEDEVHEAWRCEGRIPSRAARWLTPEAAPNRLAFDAAGGFVPSDAAWLFLNLELDHESGFVARSTYAADFRDPERPRESFGSLSLGYRWRGRYELGLSGMFGAGPGLQRTWAGGPGVYVGFGTPEGLRLTVTVFGMLMGSVEPGGRTSAMAIPYELQIPVLVLDRARLFVVNRGFFTFSTPELFAHRAELHALIDDRWRIFGGLLLEGQSQLGVGGVIGAGMRFGDR